ncbi:MAG: hypothetical protein R3281_16170, partial [Balneolaceae bacterium]|nr:hypothetical protein [Balneolaceae bacterium]
MKTYSFYGFIIAVVVAVGLVAAVNGEVQAQSQGDPSGWIKAVDDIDPDRYFGVTVANGMIGLVSSAEPLYLVEWVLFGVLVLLGGGG